MCCAQCLSRLTLAALTSRIYASLSPRLSPPMHRQGWQPRQSALRICPVSAGRAKSPRKAHWASPVLTRLSGSISRTACARSCGRTTLNRAASQCACVSALAIAVSKRKMRPMWVLARWRWLAPALASWVRKRLTGWRQAASWVLTSRSTMRFSNSQPKRAPPM